jgi:hypothetical protein
MLIRRGWFFSIFLCAAITAQAQQNVECPT